MSQSALILQLILAGITTGSMYAIIAVGFNVIFKSTGSINFAQGEWVMLGGMVAASFYALTFLPVWLACIIGVLIVGIVGGISERLVIKPLKSFTPMLVTLLSIGIAIVTKSLVMLLLGKTPMGYPPISGSGTLSLNGISIRPQGLWVIAVAIVFMLATQFFFNRTLLGKAMTTAAVDREAASLMGIDVNRTIMWAFIFAALAGGVAGVVITPLTMTSFDQGTLLGFKGFSAAMLGGLGSLHGALVGGLLLGILESLGAGLISSQFKEAVSFILLLTILFLRPKGILGKEDVTKV